MWIAGSSGGVVNTKKTVTDQILEYIYPPRCPICGDISQEGICKTCRSSIDFIEDDHCLKCGKPLIESREVYCDDCKHRKHYYIQGRSLLSYQGPVRESLYRLKYNNKREYASIYADEMMRYLGRWLHRLPIDLIVPIPLHSMRRRERGYNQAALIARPLGRQLQIPVMENLLLRTRETIKQKELTSQERYENLRQAFYVQKPLKGRPRILLVDDIYTTGSTVDAAARTLLEAGAGEIYIITIAIGG